ncbi:MAG: hypothetical protein SchgKO_11690 [Schleiferiaceae bacterium]
MKRAIMLLAAMAFGFGSFAQETETEEKKYGTWSIGADLGGTYFWGDHKGFNSNSNTSKGTMGFGASLYLTKNISSVFGIEGQGSYRSWTGRQANEYFKNTSYFEGALLGTINLTNLSFKEKPQKYAFIAFGGMGMSLSKPTAYDVDDNELRVAVPEGSDWHNELSLIFGGQFKYRLTDNLDLDLRAQGYKWFGDAEDAFVNGKFDDAGVYGSVGVTYHFGDKTPIIWAAPFAELKQAMDNLEDDMATMSTDSDGDGVSDKFDKENDTPEGVTVDGAGRAADTDGDGVPDHMDEDPFTPKNAKVDSQGREIDTDGDGVPDSRDLDNNTKEGTMVNFQGVEIKQGGGVGAYLPSVYFKFNSTSVDASNHQRLASVARAMKANPDLKLKVVGYSDKQGPENYNKKLSERRAKAVVKELSQTYGIDESRFTIESQGPSNAISGSRNDVNRRVEFEVMD